MGKQDFVPQFRRKEVSIDVPEVCRLIKQGGVNWDAKKISFAEMEVESVGEVVSQTGKAALRRLFLPENGELARLNFFKKNPLTIDVNSIRFPPRCRQ
jgi:hypothetical protein